MPSNSGCAFVVVLHVDPDRESQMAIAPDTDLKVCNGRLEVSKPSEARGHRHPVDVLFKSLALDQRERAIAIVLSGTGSNGTDGLKEIRAVGGMSLVQTPETAKFDGMPRSAIAAETLGR
jgi:two-component system CheB/CheR fusion protein